MSDAPKVNRPATLDPERVAYWYFRLNGFLQIENFIVHPERYGSQRTDADVLAVRFPYRAERFFDPPFAPMLDDEARLGLSDTFLDVVIAEVKTNQPCTLNGPWTREDRKNVHRVLAAVGCLPVESISKAAADVYRNGVHTENQLRIRLVAIGRDRSDELRADFPKVTQLIWADMLQFIWERFDAYRRQKTQVDQWDEVGRAIKQLADSHYDAAPFIADALRRMGIQGSQEPLKR